MIKKFFVFFTLLKILNVSATEPCQNINTITCGNPVTFNVSGLGDLNYQNNFSSNCAFNNNAGGKENIYSFTPTVTGTYEFEIISATVGNVDYLWKDASFGCDNMNWNCINRVYSTGSFVALNFNAGTEYYILLNSETTNEVSQTFNIKCARVICNEIVAINCGETITFTQFGYGDPDYNSNFSLNGCAINTGSPGREQIYELPPSTSPYQINIISIVGTGSLFMEYLWKNVDAGCNNIGWNCIDGALFTGPIATQIPSSLSPIYLLINSATTTSLTHTFTVNCSNLEVEDFINSNSIIFFPNPTKTVLNLQTKDNTKIDKVYLTDLSGKILVEQTQNTSQLNVENLSTGVYIVQLYSGSYKYVVKFLKQ